MCDPDKIDKWGWNYAIRYGSQQWLKYPPLPGEAAFLSRMLFELNREEFDELKKRISEGRYDSDLLERRT